MQGPTWSCQTRLGSEVCGRVKGATVWRDEIRRGSRRGIACNHEISRGSRLASACAVEIDP